MKNIIVKFSNGDEIVTSINGTKESIEAYYIGKQFNIGDGAGGDLMVTGESISWLGE